MCGIVGWVDWERDLRRTGPIIAAIRDPSSPLVPLLDRAAAEELVRADGAAFEPAWFGQLMGGAQIFAYLIQVDAWLREYRVRLV